MRYYVINKTTGARMCQDHRYRTFASFGTFPECVKVWKHKGWAQRKINHLNWRRVSEGFNEDGNVATLLALPFNKVMDAAGNILDSDD